MGNSATQQKLEGVVGFFDGPASLIHAMEKVAAANYQSFDAFTPYPVHGLDQAQGLKRSKIPYVTFAGGLAGGLGGFALQYWTSAIDWPLIVAGKPFNSWPAFVPVMFETTVLLAGISTFLGILMFCRLPNLTKKSFDPNITRDKFAIMIEAPPQSVLDPEEDTKKNAKYKKFDENEAMNLLKQVGAQDVKKVYAEAWF